MNTEQNKPDKKNTKPSKLKSCGICSKEFPVLWKRITVDSKQLSVCKGCADKHMKKKVKEKAVKAKEKRKEKREKITDKKLDTVFAKLVKDIYPCRCHSCGKGLEKGTKDCQACHFVQRGRKSTRWDIRNVLPGCGYCNGFVQSHVYELGKATNKYWGEGTAEKLRFLERKDKQWTEPQKKALYELFTCPPTGENLQEVRLLIHKEYQEIYNQ